MVVKSIKHYIKKMSQEELKTAYHLETSSKYREEIVKGIKDLAFLETLALESESWIIRYIAVGKITNQEILEKIALHDDDYDVRAEATKKITNQKVLEQIVLNDSEEEVRRIAIKKTKIKKF